jgi:hypothetical protein
VLFLGQAPTRGDADAMRVFAAHNVTIMFVPPDLTHVLQPVDPAWVRRLKALLSAAYHR